MADWIRRPSTRVTMIGGLPSFPSLPLRREDQAEESRYFGRFTWIIDAMGGIFQLVAR